MKKLKLNTSVINQPMIQSDESTVNNFKRLIAYIIDWYAASALASIPIVFTYSLFFKDLTITQDLTQLSFPFNFIVGILALIVYLAYFIIIPVKVYPGQTFGKRIMDIKVVKDDGKDVDYITLIKREVIGVMIVEGYIAASSSFFHQMINMIIGINLNEYYVYVFGIITLISILCACASPKRKMFHDMIAKTQLIIYQQSA